MNTIPLPKVSVLIPAHNEEKYISKTLEAVLKQDYPFFEIIVVNNASDDKTSQMVSAIKTQQDKNIILVYEPNKGTGYARECGRKMASGEIIAQLDADCIPSSDWISKGVALLNSKKIVAVTGPYLYYESNFFLKWSTLFLQYTVVKWMHFFIQLFGRGAVLIGGNAFMIATVLEQAGGYNTKLSFYGDDVDLAHSLSKYGDILFANELVLKTSSRRYKKQGFFKVQTKYNKFFFDAVFKKNFNQAESIELFHPR